MSGPRDPRRGEPDPDELVPKPGFQADAETGRPLRRRRQPALAALAIVGILLLVLAIGIFGGIF